MKKIILLFFLLFCSVFAFPQWTWQNPLPQGNWLTSVYFIDPNTGYAVGYCGAIIKTINGGTDWTVLSSGVMYDFTSVFFTDAYNGFVVADQVVAGAILKTTD